MTMTATEEVLLADITQEYPSRVEKVPVGEVQRDQRVNTRPPNETWIRKRVTRFSWMMLGIVTLSRRGNGDLIVLDGQNRCELLKRAQGREARIKAEIYEGLSQRAEAQLFLGLNDDRPPNAVSKYLAEVTAGNIAAQRIDEIVSRYGYTIGAERACGVLSCIQQIQILWRRDVDKQGTKQPMALERTLATINGAWRPNEQSRWAAYQDATHMAMVAGLGMIYFLNGEAVDVQRMIDRAAGIPGGPEAVLHRANGLVGAKGLHARADGVLEVLLLEYNKGLKARTLPLPPGH